VGGGGGWAGEIKLQDRLASFGTTQRRKGQSGRPHFFFTVATLHLLIYNDDNNIRFYYYSRSVSSVVRILIRLCITFRCPSTGVIGLMTFETPQSMFVSPKVENDDNNDPCSNDASKRCGPSLCPKVFILSLLSLEGLFIFTFRK